MIAQSTVERLNMFLPLLGVIIGGLLTIAGSIYLRKVGAKEERHKLLREKLEELCFQVYELDKWVSNAGRIAFSTASGQISNTKGTPIEDSPIMRIEMLVGFYFHSLRPYSEPLSVAVENYRKTLFGFYADILDGRQKPNQSIQLIGTSAQEIEKLRLHLLKELEREVQKYI